MDPHFISCEFRLKRGEEVSGDIPMNQKSLHRIADSGILAFRIHCNPDRQIKVGIGIDIQRTKTIGMS